MCWWLGAMALTSLDYISVRVRSRAAAAALISSSTTVKVSHPRHPVPRMYSLSLQPLQLCLGALRQSRPFHHLPCFRRSRRKTTLEFARIELKARDCPPNVVITDRIRKSVSVWHNCGERCKHEVMVHRIARRTMHRPSPYPHPSRNLDDSCDVDSSQ